MDIRAYLGEFKILVRYFCDRKVPQDDSNQRPAARVHAPSMLCVWLSRQPNFLQPGMTLHLFLVSEPSHRISRHVTGASV